MRMSGKTIRFNRLFGGGHKPVVVAVDHGAEFGPTPGLINLPAALRDLREADGIEALFHGNADRLIEKSVSAQRSYQEKRK